MVFTKREKIIIAASIAAVCVLVLDVSVLTPLVGRRAAAQVDMERLVVELARARNVLKRRQQLGHKWREMLNDGMRRDPAEAESQMLRSIRDWSADEGVRLSLLRPERSTEKTELPEITVHVAGTGSMAEVSRLLWQIEQSQAPIKIKMLQLGSRKDGTDDLSMQLKVSTIHIPPTGLSTGRVSENPRLGGGDR